MATSPGVEISESTPYYGYVYMWCDTTHNKFYVGSHKGSIFDKYNCGSKWLNSVIRKRPETLRMRVLEYYYGNDRVELYKLEDNWLKFYNVASNPAFYNFKNNATGGAGPNKHKGKKRKDYTPGWVDHRVGKKAEEIYREPQKFRENLSQHLRLEFQLLGYGRRKGKKNNIPDPRKGKTAVEIYGYDKIGPVPPKPFIVTIQKPNEIPYDIYCKNEKDFYTIMRMESSTLQQLKKNGFKIIKRIQTSTKHHLPKHTIIHLRFIEEFIK